MNLDTAASTWHIHQLTDNNRPLYVLDDSFEDAWLPIAGPSVVALVRFLGRSLQEGPLQLPPFELAYHLGLAGSSQKWSPFGKAVKRAQRFGFIDAVAPAAFGLWSQTYPPRKNLEVHRLERVANWDESMKEWKSA